MDLPSPLLRDLLQLSPHLATGSNLHDTLADLVSAVRAAVPSYRGMIVTMYDGSQPVTLTAFPDGDDGDDDPILTSLRIPFVGLISDRRDDSRAAGRIVLYAARPGAFVDLAADLGHALNMPILIGHPGPSERDRRAAIDGDGRDPTQRDGHASIALDVDLPPRTRAPGIDGLEQLSTVNRAIGILIDQGHDPEQARHILHRDATANGLELHVYAERLLRR